MFLSLKSISPEETFRMGKILGRLALAGDIFCLDGDLGAGKTVFAKGVASGLGVEGRVVSPTFTLINEHRGRLPFYHMDVYRLGGPEDLADLGYEEYIFGLGVTLVEWAEIVAGALPGERLDIKIMRDGEDHRIIGVTPHGDRYLRLAEELKNNVCTGN